MNLGGVGPRMWWVPTGFKDVDFRRFAIRAIQEEMPDGRRRTRGKLYMSTIPLQTYRPSEQQVRDAMPSATMQNYREVKHPEWILRVVYGDEESRLGQGLPVADALYFYVWIKGVLLREGLQGVERWSQGIIVGKINEDRAGAADTQTMEKERQAMVDALTKMRSRYVIVVGSKDEVDVKTGGMEGYQLVQGMIDYIDDCIMAVCTGAVLMSSKSNAGSLSSLSRDEVGKETQRGVLLYDQNKIDEDISIDVGGMFVRQNWSLLRSLALDKAGPPQFRTVGAKNVNPDRAMARFAQLSTIATTTGEPIEVRKDEFFESVDLTPAGPDDDVIVFGGAQQQAGFGDLRGPGGKFAPEAHGGDEEQEPQGEQFSAAGLLQKTLLEEARRRKAARLPLTPQHHGALADWHEQVAKANPAVAEQHLAHAKFHRVRSSMREQFPDYYRDGDGEEPKPPVDA
mgnify:CR=1 FL=1